MKNALISIGESIHASIPKTGQIMKELHDLRRRCLHEGRARSSTTSGP